MDQIKPPTDSLYKFIAIFGLVAFIWSYYAAFQWQDLVWNRVVSFSERVDDPDGNKYEQFKKVADGSTAELDAFMRTVPPSERGAFLMQYRSLSELEGVVHQIRWARNGGIIMIVLGFGLWYIKIQQYVDRTLRRDALKP